MRCGMEIFSILITLTALFSFINYRYIKLPASIGVMLISLLFSVALVILATFYDFVMLERAVDFVRGIEFERTLMGGMLSLLLFAGALHVDLNDFLERKWTILSLATFGVLLSTFMVGTIVYFISLWVGLGLPFIYALLFGALISPTDPIAVLGMLKQARAPRSLSAKIAGESLFNDGIGVVIFATILGIALRGAGGVDWSGVMVLFAKEAVGGVFLGLALGVGGYMMLKRVDSYQVEILITLALVTGGYTLALHLHTSGPIAIVVAGLFIGNHGRIFGISDSTTERLSTFWELIDQILNALLFVMIGLELLVVRLVLSSLLMGLASIPSVLLSRFVAVSIPIGVLKSLKRTFSPNAVYVLTWGGLRGGLSVAMALSIPRGSEKDLILAMTYCVVVFSILVQGLTVKKLIKPGV